MDKDCADNISVIESYTMDMIIHTQIWSVITLITEQSDYRKIMLHYQNKILFYV